MIHQLLNFTRPLFVIDCETTGTDVHHDRIIELGFQRWEAEGMTKEWRSLVNPGVPIPEAATKVHHITDNDMRCCSHCRMPRNAHPYYAGPEPTVECPEFHVVPTFTQLAANLARGFTNCDFAGKNVRFDLRILSAEFARAKVEWNYTGARVIDAERLEQLAVPRSLSDLHKKYTGREHDGAHGALSDVRASTTVIVSQLMEHGQLPRDLDALHNLQWPNWIDPEGKFRFVDGVACVAEWGKHKGKPMRSVPRDYWDFILGADFSPEVKTIAGQAKLGKFPEVKK